MSIYNKIRIIFVVSFLFVTAFFASTFYIEKSKHIQSIEKRYVRTALFLQKHFRQSMHREQRVDFSEDTVKLYLKESNFRQVNRKNKAHLLKHAVVIKKRKILRAKMEILRVKDKLYLSLENHRFHVLLRDKEKREFPFELLLGYLATLVFLLGLYIWLTRSLKPLKALQSKIEEVGKGDLSVSFKSEKSDEIAQVSNAFDTALRKLESLIDSRQLFLQKHFRQNMYRDEDVDFSEDTVKLYLKESNFRQVKSENKEHILKYAKVIKKRKVLRSKMEILKVKDKRYFLLDNHRFHILLKDKEKNEFPFALLLGYIASLVFLLGLYVWLTRSLKPLKTLQSKIGEVAKGDLAVSFKSNKSDEIAQVSNAFDDALRKLESLIDSRQLFLRAIMHELKTPIGKGKILNTFLEEEKLKEGYEEVFERLELLLNEFAKIEQMLSANYEVKLAKYNAKDLVDQALELMILDDETLENHVTVVEKSPLILSTDFTLFPLAIKNLIDNAMKYGKEHKVEIVIDKNGISVLSSGVQFTEDIESYYQPFHAKGKGLGLGLYIVHNSLEMLKLELDYHYKDEKNNFTIRV